MIGWIIAVVALLALGVALANRPNKRFGLKEAQAALHYVRSENVGQAQVSARTVMAVVVGVLGYENVVAADVQDEVARLDGDTAQRDKEIAEDEKTIEELRAEIARLRAANENSSASTAELRQVAEIFRG